MKSMEFPVRHFEGNLVLNVDNDAWAFYELIGYEYDYISSDKKESVSAKLESLFSQIGSKFHLLALPKYTSVKEVHDRMKQRITGPLRNYSHQYIDAMVPEVEKYTGEEDNDYSFYIGVKLPDPGVDDFSLRAITKTFNSLLNKVFVLLGLEEPDVSDVALDHYYNSENLYFNLLNSKFNVNRITPFETAWLIRRNFFRGLGKMPSSKFVPPSLTENKGQPISLETLTEGTIDNLRKNDILSLSQSIDGEDKEGYCAFLTTSFIPTDALYTVGTEFIYGANNLGFLPDISIRVNPLNQNQISTLIKNKKKELDDQVNHAAKNNSQASYEVAENLELVKELEIFTKVTKKPQLEVAIVFGVSAPSEEELRLRIKQLKNFYDEYYHMELAQPRGDQFKLFNEFIPGGEQYVRAYTQTMEPGALGGGMFGATTQIGDSEGICIGLQGDKAVYMNAMDYTQGKQGTLTRSLSMDFVGSKGSGKSFAANLIVYTIVMAGGKALIIDPKGDRYHWKETLPDIADQINIVNVDATPENKGRLDPWLISEDLKEGEKLALQICEYLTKISPTKERKQWVGLRKVIREVTSEPGPCMENVIYKLLNHEDPLVTEIGEHLASYKDLHFASLLIGDGTQLDPLSMDKSINVLLIQNMKMPAKDKKEEAYDMEERLSMALMFPIGQFTHDFIKYDNSVLKIAFFDESWFMEKTDIGRDIIDRIRREGRARNAGLIKASQIVRDMEGEDESLVGVKFVFQNKSRKEAAKSLEYLGIEPDEHLVDMILNFEPGTCLMQDIYGRTGIVQMVAWFEDLHQAFDTTPPVRTVEPELEMAIS